MPAKQFITPIRQIKTNMRVLFYKANIFNNIDHANW